MNQCKVCNDYRWLNTAHEVYCDQPGTPCDGKTYLEMQDENSKNHNKTGGAVNWVDIEKQNTAFFENKTAVDLKWNMTAAQKKDYELFEKALKEDVDPWGYAEYGRIDAENKKKQEEKNKQEEKSKQEEKNQKK